MIVHVKPYAAKTNRPLVPYYRKTSHKPHKNLVLFI